MTSTIPIQPQQDKRYISLLELRVVFEKIEVHDDVVVFLSNLREKPRPLGRNLPF